MDTAVTIAFYRYCRILCRGHHHIIVLGLFHYIEYEFECITNLIYIFCVFYIVESVIESLIFSSYIP